MKPLKTNAVRILEKAGVAFDLIPYEVDESDLSAVHVAAQLGEPVDQVFKTLVLKGDTLGYFVCIIPGAEELDLKKAARLTGNKSCELIPMKDLPVITGYIRGACSPVGMKKQFPTFLDATALWYSRIYVSAGVRGVQVHLAAADLIKLIGAEVVELIA